jgi:hypothetical protein
MILGRESLKNKKPFVIACAVLALDIKTAAKKLGIDIGVKFWLARTSQRASGKTSSFHR